MPFPADDLGSAVVSAVGAVKPTAVFLAASFVFAGDVIVATLFAKGIGGGGANPFTLFASVHGPFGDLETPQPSTAPLAYHCFRSWTLIGPCSSSVKGS